MPRISSFIRELAAAAADKGRMKIHEVKIFFSAPNPKTADSADTLNINPKDPTASANFQWVTYQMLFSVDPQAKGEDTVYYIYSVGLNPQGTEELPNKVFESDSDWSGKNKDTPSDVFSPGDVKRAFPSLLRGPNLHPSKVIQTIYVNTGKDDKGKPYSSEEFKRFFDNDFYIVLNPGKRILKNPFGKDIMVDPVKDEEEVTK